MFIVFLAINKNMEIKETIRLTKLQESGLIIKQESYYILMYCYLNYLSPNKIYNHYKIIIISTPIKILVKRKIYKIYIFIKITNRIPKTFSKYKDRKLTLI
jgi:hypothetical protein